MKFEFSAGGIVFKKEGSDILILISQHSQHLGWVFPKGLIGDHVENESKEATAIREVEEETGAQGEILKQIKPVTYWYVMDGIKRKKTVYYFIMKYLGGDITKHDNEMKDVKWVEKNKVLESLTFKSDKDSFEEAIPEIEKIANS